MILLRATFTSYKTGISLCELFTGPFEGSTFEGAKRAFLQNRNGSHNKSSSSEELNIPSVKEI